MGISDLKKRGLWVLLAAVVLLLVIIAAAGHTGGGEVPPVAEPGFSLNGADYPLSPVVQDFIDRGWRLGKSTEQMGNYVEGEGPKDLIATGYLLTSGSNRMNLYLNVDDCKSGLRPGECRVRSLSLYGKNVDSFCLDGQELAQTDSSRIVELLGDPEEADEEEHGVMYRYSMPEKGISEITFTFPHTLDTVAQIFMVFDTA